MAAMLVVFAPQIALYGVGIVLAGVLQAHRRFLAAAAAPLLSSVVVMVTYLLYAAVAQGRGNDLTRLPGHASTILAAGTTLGVVALSLPLLIPVHRAGIRLRPTWRFPKGIAQRAGSLAVAGLLALVAQQMAVLVALWLSQHRGGPGTLNVYTYVQAVYLLPYAVLAVPVATAAFPALATGPQRASLATGPDRPSLATSQLEATLTDGRGWTATGGAEQTLASSARAITITMCVGAAVLVAVAPPVGAFFSALDAGRDSRAGADALAALPAALTAFAPGLLGLGLIALLTRALYATGRPGAAGGVAAVGWLTAAGIPLFVLHENAGPRETLQSLGAASSLGMTAAAIGLFLAVRRQWGPLAFHGFGRTAAVAVGSGVLSAGVGRAIALWLDPHGLAGGFWATLLVALSVLTLCAVSIWFGDNGSARLVLARRRRPAEKEMAK